jgi:hypothetical protein
MRRKFPLFDLADVSDGFGISSRSSRATILDVSVPGEIRGLFALPTF